MYDFIFITHLPSFYKVNLYNEIAKYKKIKVIFIGTTSKIRTNDFQDTNFEFDYIFINENNFETKNTVLSIYRLVKVLLNLRFNKIIVGGWDLIEFWIPIILFHKKYLCVAVESSIYEYHENVYLNFLKKVFLKNISQAYLSGKSQKELIEKFSYKGIKTFTGGVGLFNIVPYEFKNKKFQNKYLYVGRLSEEKNIGLLIDTFSRLPLYTLTIVGTGPLYKQFSQETKEKSNISLIGHVEQNKIKDIYLSHDVFILPSLKEPWGLVVEEALYFGLPVIVSNHVGCKNEFVEELSTGLIFDLDDKYSLESKINLLNKDNNYDKYLKNVQSLDFNKIQEEQVNQYTHHLLEINNPKISIVTVVFNDVNNIECTIKSVANQKYKNIEYIVIDGGSDDGTIDVIKIYKEKINFFLSEKDEGIYDAMNKAIDIAKGDWIYFLNSGDLFYHDKILLDIFSDPIFSKSIDLIYGNIDIKYKTFIKTKFSGNLYDFDDGMQFCHQSVFIKTEIIRKYKFDVKYKLAADYDMIYKMYKDARTFYKIDKIIAIILPDGVSDKNQDQVIKEYKNISQTKKYITIFFMKKVIKKILPNSILEIIRRYH